MGGTPGRDGSGKDRQGSYCTVYTEWCKVRCDSPWGHRDTSTAPHCQWEHPQRPQNILGLGWRRQSPHSPKNSDLLNHGSWEWGDPTAFSASQCPPCAGGPCHLCGGVPHCPPHCLLFPQDTSAFSAAYVERKRNGAGFLW